MEILFIKWETNCGLLIDSGNIMGKTKPNKYVEKT